MSQHTLMELFIENIEQKEAFTNNQDELEHWSYLIRNRNGQVISIIAAWQNLKGKISLNWLPETVQTLSMGANELTGTIDLSVLPEGMEKLDLYLNKLTGPIDLLNLPVCMVHLNLGVNQLWGTLNLTKLPETMERLYLEKNAFYGESDFTHLPDLLTDIDVSDNTRLSGRYQEHPDRTFEYHGTEIEVIEYDS